jgi:uncharacterized membrane protein YcaP (DUF421 family)
MISILSFGKIILSCFVVYLFIIVAIRLFGRKEISQLTVLDLVFILLISNSVQNAMVGPDTSLSGGLVAAGSLFVLNYIFQRILYRFPSLSKTIQGHPLLLIYKGRVIEQNLKKIQLTIAELEEAIREHGAEYISEVDQAIFEVNGNISILSKGYTQHTVKKKKDHKIEDNITPGSI